MQHGFYKLDDDDQLALLDVLIKLKLLDGQGNLTHAGKEYLVTGELPKLTASISGELAGEQKEVTARLEALQAELAAMGVPMTFSVEVMEDA